MVHIKLNIRPRDGTEKQAKNKRWGLSVLVVSQPGLSRGSEGIGESLQLVCEVGCCTTSVLLTGRNSS